MTTAYRLFIGFALAAMLPSAAAAQDVTYDYNAARDLTTLKTYSFRSAATSEKATEQTGAYDSPFVTERTQAAIAAELNSRGLIRDDENPSVYVTTRRTFTREYLSYPFGSPYGWSYGYYGPYMYSGWAWGGYSGWGGWYTEEKIKGTLTIELADAATGELLWRGLGERTVHPTSKPERHAKRINKEVAKIFRNFPVGAPRDDDDDE